MKVTQISGHIWSVNMRIIIPIHVWLVKEKTESFSSIRGSR